MTTHSRSLRTISGLFVALALTASMAACGKSSELPPGPGQGSGQFGDSPIGPGAGDVDNQATPASPLENSPESPGNATENPGNPPGDQPEQTPEATDGPAPPAGPVLVPIDPSILLLWPSPADCVSHNPATVSIKYTASGPLWQVVDGGHYLLAYKREVDAQAGLALAKAYKKHCFIGRGNTRPDRARYIMDYWLEPVQPSPSIANPDCIAHNPANLSIADLGPTGWRVEDGSQAIALFDTKEDAQKGVLVMKHYNRNCYIGRGYDGADRLEYITNWFIKV